MKIKSHVVIGSPCRFTSEQRMPFDLMKAHIRSLHNQVTPKLKGNLKACIGYQLHPKLKQLFDRLDVNRLRPES